MLFELPVPFWKELLDHSAVESLQANRPAMVICGGRDWRLADEDIAGWERVADRFDTIAFGEFPELDHFLMPSDSAENPSPGRDAVNVDWAVVEEIVDWIESR
jgi:hypothetical protein